jgi:hypothetical protein
VTVNNNLVNLDVLIVKVLEKSASENHSMKLLHVVALVSAFSQVNVVFKLPYFFISHAIVVGLRSSS